jgi:antitoxin CcdA
MNAPTKLAEVRIDEAAVNEARALGVDVVSACEAGLRAEIKRAADERWIEENRAAVDASNAWVEKHGLPLAKYRQF